METIMQPAPDHVDVDDLRGMRPEELAVAGAGLAARFAGRNADTKQAPVPVAAFNSRIQPITAGCSWCGGSGTWTDPKTGQEWPCIQCKPGGR